jgi:hypothetical protein
LRQHGLLDQLIQSQRIIRCAHRSPISILLHSVLEQLCTLSLDQ